jgi:poly-gamma-glutamate synthesis protein (capsule biosynthesis protein)
MYSVGLSAFTLIVAELCLAIAGLRTAVAQPCNAENLIPAMFTDITDFEALTRSKPTFRLQAGAVTVPHHLTAASLIAAGLGAINPIRIEKILLISPDHFKRARRPFATTKKSFETLLGSVCTAADDAARLLSNQALVEESDLFAREHGIGAVLPFIRHFFPGVAIVPISVSITSRQADWDSMVTLLRPIVTDRTLVVQSTDFSHYLTAGHAALRDQVTLNLLAARDVQAVGRLGQPQHLDSRGSQYIVMRLMAERGPPIVLYNQNSQVFSDAFESETTSGPPAPHSAEGPTLKLVNGMSIVNGERRCLVAPVASVHWELRIMPRVFISHSSLDGLAATKIKQWLTKLSLQLLV